MAIQHDIRFSGFDAKSPDFLLVVNAAEKFDLAVIEPPANVTGPIDTRSLFGTKWIIDKISRGRLIAIQIPVRKAGAADHEFARATDGNRHSSMIQDVYVGMFDGFSNRNMLVLWIKIPGNGNVQVKVVLSVGP
jgi:hypothetical protein